MKSVRGPRARRTRRCVFNGLLVGFEDPEIFGRVLAAGSLPGAALARTGAGKISYSYPGARSRDSKFYLQNGLFYRAVPVPRVSA